MTEISSYWDVVEIGLPSRLIRRRRWPIHPGEAHVMLLGKSLNRFGNIDLHVWGDAGPVEVVYRCHSRHSKFEKWSTNISEDVSGALAALSLTGPIKHDSPSHGISPSLEGALANLSLKHSAQLIADSANALENTKPSNSNSTKRRYSREDDDNQMATSDKRGVTEKQQARLVAQETLVIVHAIMPSLEEQEIGNDVFFNEFLRASLDVRALSQAIADNHSRIVVAAHDPDDECDLIDIVKSSLKAHEMAIFEISLEDVMFSCLPSNRLVDDIFSACELLNSSLLASVNAEDCTGTASSSKSVVLITCADVLSCVDTDSYDTQWRFLLSLVTSLRNFPSVPVILIARSWDELPYAIRDAFESPPSREDLESRTQPSIPSDAPDNEPAEIHPPTAQVTGSLDPEMEQSGKGTQDTKLNKAKIVLISSPYGLATVTRLLSSLFAMLGLEVDGPTCSRLGALLNGMSLAEMRDVFSKILEGSSFDMPSLKVVSKLEAMLIKKDSFRKSRVANVSDVPFTLFPASTSVLSFGNESASLKSLVNQFCSTVIGQPDAKRVLFESLVMPRVRPNQMAALGLMRAPRGVVLYGPPGAGKTLLVSVAAREAGFNLLAVSASDLVRGDVGETEKRVSKLFLLARSCEPCVLFFDEADAVLGNRADAGPSQKKMVSQFFLEMDALVSQGETGDAKLVLIAATNSIDKVDAAFFRQGRFERRARVGELTEPEDMINALMQFSQSSSKLGSVDWRVFVNDHLFPRTRRGLTGARLRQLAMRAEMESDIRGEGESVTQQDLSMALRHEDLAKGF